MEVMGLRRKIEKNVLQKGCTDFDGKNMFFSGPHMVC